ncbi:hypothetical protein T492DRAFT_832053 [Pavlovales sp. CCMP2436]|nr:hypothetical protein T492DRAFT_832053 [Pavlovales sp. CCMP2436]
MTFLDFCEALARVTTFKYFPTDAEIRAKGVTDTAAFFDKLVKDGEMKQFALTRRVDTVEEQKEGRPLEEVLSKCLDVIVRRLDRTGDGLITKRDFMLSLKF